eukprot:m.102974 g.102974  ORF g.102974 m.102974 type:complete len:84 (+) comp9088_c1_seq1:884-1135(+)
MKVSTGSLNNSRKGNKCSLFLEQNSNKKENNKKKVPHHLHNPLLSTSLSFCRNSIVFFFFLIYSFIIDVNANCFFFFIYSTND